MNVKKLKKIELKTTKITVKGPDGKDVEMDFDYKLNMLNALNQSPTDERTGQPRGFGPVEMRKRLKLIKQVEESKDNILLLEESEYNELKKCVHDQKWQVANSTIVEYLDAVENAEEVEVAEKKEGVKK